ncbi:MAG: tetratricopeptide repeat protein [Cytophagales bacterium]|nr:tetratricopeptide repeat protein [Cytophagales bacterium]
MDITSKLFKILKFRPVCRQAGTINDATHPEYSGLIIIFILIFQQGYNISAKTVYDTIAADTTSVLNGTLQLANHYFHLADSFHQVASYDSSSSYYQKAGTIFLKLAQLQESPRSRVLPHRIVTGVTGEIRDRPDDYLILWEKYIECHNQLAWNLAMYQAKFEKAITVLNNILSLGIKKLGENHYKIGDVYEKLGIIYARNGDYQNALENFEQSLLIFLQTFEADHSKLASCYSNLGNIYYLKSDYQKALKYHEQSLSLYLKNFGRKHSNVAKCYNNIANIYGAMGDFYTALEYCQQSLRIKLSAIDKSVLEGKTHSSLHLDLASSYNNLGNILADIGEINEAVKNYQRSIKIHTKFLGEKHPSVGYPNFNLGMLYKENGNYEKALHYHKKSLTIDLYNFGSEHFYVAWDRIYIADVYVKMNKFDDGYELLKNALPILLKNIGSYHPLVARRHLILASLFFKKNDIGNALYYYQKAIQSLVKGFSAVSIYVNPVLPTIYEVKEGKGTVNSMPDLLEALEKKAEGFYVKWETRKK